jgi:hypothetical protein
MEMPMAMIHMQQRGGAARQGDSDPGVKVGSERIR